MTTDAEPEHQVVAEPMLQPVAHAADTAMPSQDGIVSLAGPVARYGEKPAAETAATALPPPDPMLRSTSLPPLRRRHVLAASILLLPYAADARTIQGALPWAPNVATPPPRVDPGAWLFFTEPEAVTITAMADRLIPSDAQGPGAGEGGCALFLDRQLAGPHGSAAWLYMQGPFAAGTPEQGPQGEQPPAVLYRAGLAAIAKHCATAFNGMTFPGLTGVQQDSLLTAIEDGRAGIAGLAEKPFFDMLLAGVMESFFADPTYGGNREMAGWKLLGFPGVRYDNRDVLAQPGQPHAPPPVSLRGRPGWDRS